MIYLLIVYGLLRYFKLNSRDGGLPNPTGLLCVPVFHLKHKSKVQTQSDKNSRNMHVHNSLLNVAIHIPCINIYHTGYYQLEIVFALCANPQ